MMIEEKALVPLGSGQMFDRIAARYDVVNRVVSLGLDQRWRRRVVRALGLDCKTKRRGGFARRASSRALWISRVWKQRR